MFWNKQKEVETVEVKVDHYVMLPPEIIERIRGERSRLGYITWYRAIYAVYDNPDIKPGRLATMIEVSWPAAKEMISRIKTRLPANYLVKE